MHNQLTQSISQLKKRISKTELQKKRYFDLLLAEFSPDLQLDILIVQHK